MTNPQTTPTMGDYADALQCLPDSWSLQYIDQVKMCASGCKIILACADYPPIIFDDGRWKEI